MILKVQVMLPVSTSQNHAIWLKSEVSNGKCWSFEWKSCNFTGITFQSDIALLVRKSYLNSSDHFASWNFNLNSETIVFSMFLFCYIPRWITKHKLGKSSNYSEALSRRTTKSKNSMSRRMYLNKVIDVSVTLSEC